MSDVETRAYVVEVTASVMPALTETEVRDAVLEAAYKKERRHGMGELSVIAYEAHNENTSRGVF